MQNREDDESSMELLAECRMLVKELESLVSSQYERSDVARYRRIIEDLRRDNERLHRENTMLKSRLIE